MRITWLLALFVLTTPAFAHHEAIFGPQSATMISRQRFASAQYYLANEGKAPAAETRSDIGVVTVGFPIAEDWSVSVTLPADPFARKVKRGSAECRTSCSPSGARFIWRAAPPSSASPPSSRRRPATSSTARSVSEAAFSIHKSGRTGRGSRTRSDAPRTRWKRANGAGTGCSSVPVSHTRPRVARSVRNSGSPGRIPRQQQ